MAIESPYGPSVRSSETGRYVRPAPSSVSLDSVNTVQSDVDAVASDLATAQADLAAIQAAADAITASGVLSEIEVRAFAVEETNTIIADQFGDPDPNDGLELPDLVLLFDNAIL